MSEKRGNGLGANSTSNTTTNKPFEKTDINLIENSHKPSRFSLFKREKTIMDYVKVYRDNGLLSIIPIKTRSKEPLIAWKQYQLEAPKEEEINTWFNKKIGEINLAILTGSINHNLIVIDLDSKESFDKLKNILFKVGLANTLLFENNWIIKTGKGYHIYFRVLCNKDQFKELFKTKVRYVNGIDIKGEGGYVLAPPSIHPNGNFYEFLEEDIRQNPKRVKEIPIIELDNAKRLLETLKESEIKEAPKEETPQVEEAKTETAKEVPKEEIELGETQIANIVNMLTPYYKEGYRDLIVFSLNGYLLKLGVKRDSIKTLVETLAKTNNDNELANRLYQVDRAYQIASKEGLDKLLGISGLKETLTKVLKETTQFNDTTIEEEVEKTLSEIREIIKPKKKTEKRTIVIEKVEEAKTELEEYPKELNINNLYYEIVKEIHKRAVFKNFYRGNADLGLFYFNGVTYEEGENIITTFIDQISKEEEFAKKFYVIDNKVKRPPTPLEIDMSLKQHVRNEIISKVKQHTMTEYKVEPLKIAFANGLVLNWEKFKETGDLEKSVEEANPNTIVFHLIPHDLALDRLPPNYKDMDILSLAKALCPKTLELFTQWSPNNEILLFEIIGYTFYPKYSYHKAIMLYDTTPNHEGNNGKSTYLKVIRNILGEKNVSSVSLQDLITNRFALAQIKGKLANIQADLSEDPIYTTGRFRIVTGEDLALVEEKFKDPYPYELYAKQIFSANRLPPVYTDIGAFWKRWILIPFPNQFSLVDNFLEKTLNEEEYEGIILVSLIAFLRVLQRNSFTYSISVEELAKKWLRESNNVIAFLEDMIEEGRLAKQNEGKIDSDTLYNMYIEYCNQNDIDSEDRKSKGEFTKELERLGYKKVKITGYYYYKGLIIAKEIENKDNLLIGDKHDS